MGKNKKYRDGIVYSTDDSFDYEYSGNKEADTLPPSQQRLYLRREVRNGKPMIVVKEFVGTSNDLKTLEKQLKNHCGVGGSSKDGEILIQGENLEKIKSFLASKGYQTKGS